MSLDSRAYGARLPSGCNFAKFSKKLRYRRDSVRRRSLRPSRSFKVTDFNTIRQNVCDFMALTRILSAPLSSYRAHDDDDDDDVR